MEYRKLGSTGMLVSRVGFGGIPIMRTTEAKATEVLLKALEKGVNYVDTHVGYGDSELKIGNALKAHREEYYLSTKLSVHTAREAQQSLRKSLKRLKTDYIDLLYIKNLDSAEVYKQAMSRNGSLRVAREAQKAGIVRHIGFTSHTEKITWQALRSGEYTAVMYPYNILNLSAEKRVLDYCTRHNIGFVCMKPVAGGLLTVPSKVFARMAKGKARTTAAVAMRYCLAHPAVTTVIPGLNTVPHLNQALTALGHGMTAAEREQAVKKVVKLGQGFCRNCGYCRPCPQNIEINEVLRFYHYFTSYDLQEYAQDKYKRLAVKATACAACGACLKKCPYSINIPQKLRVAHRVLTGGKKK